ncbi:hypothetical protein HN385_07155 [archaeon]|jgi:potassium/hydrogen antiporter|nr:hypothetical protein [archaeon]MBT3463990.1 hypothetical protein [archaeon]MBT6868616.1 hypothetical protein [archaeon]MBT7193148.1 hypothetical protein [archaeon]MBT7381128.1 hypothetical protein [archaeon]
MSFVTNTLFAIGLILFFGFFADFLFRKLNVPDVIFLILLGFSIGPHGFNYVNPDSFGNIAPIFTTFTLLFLLFDGAFNINLSSLMKEFSNSFILTTINFVFSSTLVAFSIWLFGLWQGEISFIIALLGGFMLGGVSSSFSIPVLTRLNIDKRIYSLLALESALTDVFCIVFSLSIIEFLKIGDLGLRETMTQFVSFFAVAGLIGLIAGIFWIILIIKVFKEHNYVMTIAYLLVIYFVAEFLKGNGAIATLFFGLILNNSKQLSSIIIGLSSHHSEDKEKAITGDLGVSVTTPSEEYFYHQISFMLKTFFFVYIGILIDISDFKAVILGIGLSILIMLARLISNLITKGKEEKDRSLINSIFARGLAAAAIAQLAIQEAIPHAEFLSKVTYIVITGTIILSSARVFITESNFKLGWIKRNFKFWK